jgi:hypothetical protein
VLLTVAAGTPQARRASTWSFISEMSGDTTRVSPGRHIAGTWKHRLLPPPVGRTTTESRSVMADSIASACSGRKAS